MNPFDKHAVPTGRDVGVSRLCYQHCAPLVRYKHDVPPEHEDRPNYVHFSSRQERCVYNPNRT
jgi:hypothetical protein